MKKINMNRIDKENRCDEEEEDQCNDKQEIAAACPNGKYKGMCSGTLI
jgi:hypothetical protein